MRLLIFLCVMGCAFLLVACGTAQVESDVSQDVPNDDPTVEDEDSSQATPPGPTLEEVKRVVEGDPIPPMGHHEPPDPELLAEVEAESFKEAERKRKEALLRCYRKALKSDPLAKGIATFEITGAGTQKVRARATECPFTDSICECMTSAVRSYRYPKSSKEILTKSYELTLTDGAPQVLGIL